MEGRELEEYWEGLSLVEDWLSGGLRRDRPRPDFDSLASQDRDPQASQPGPGPGAPAPDGSPAGVGPGPSPARAEDLPQGDLAALSAGVRACVKCGLASGRKKAVFGMGVDHPLVLVVGEGPGAEEDASGLPFVGPAGQLLDRMLAAIGISRSTNAYIANIVKCRPPGNRDPAPEEVTACMPWLEAQIDRLAPRLILCLGRSATQALTGSALGITKLRGTWFEFRGIPLIATFHPSALLRDDSYKRPAWEDLKALKERLGDASLR